MTLLPASRFTLPAVRFTTPGPYRRGSGHRQLLLPLRHRCGPDGCSYQRQAISGQRVAA
jgi:hypothetical protein